MTYSDIKIGTIISGKKLVGRTNKYIQIWQCIDCGKETKGCWSQQSKCKGCKPNHNRIYYIGQIINDRMVIRKKSLYRSTLDMKCIYCGIIKEIKPSINTQCKCRHRKIKFDKMCKEYSYISDCVPQQPESNSFKNNLKSIAAYIEKNQIPDMKLSELLSELL